MAQDQPNVIAVCSLKGNQRIGLCNEPTEGDFGKLYRCGKYGSDTRPPEKEWTKSSTLSLEEHPGCLIAPRSSIQLYSRI